jgi:hypothetical protein
MKITVKLSLLLLLFVAFSCKKKSTASISVGQSYQGGIVAYVDGTGKHGLIVAKQDLSSTSIWGCQGSLIGTTNTYGQGNVNTQKIVAACADINTAARKCSDLIQDGYNDWFLPTLDELQWIYDNLHKKGIGNFAQGVYASSSEANSDPIWGPTINMVRIDFSVGYSSYTPKGGLYNVRPCRYF